MRRLSACLTVSFVVLFCISAAAAETQEVSSLNDSQLYVGIFGGAAMPEDLELTDKMDPIVDFKDLNLDEGITAGCKVGYRIRGLRKALAVEVEYVHISNTDVDSQDGFSSGGTNVQIGGEIPIHSVFLNLVLRHPGGGFHPYIGIGSGWSWFKFARLYQSANVAGFTTFGERRNATDNTFAFQGLAGLEIDLTDRVSVDLGYRYYQVEPELDDPRVDLTYIAHIAAVGVNYNF